MLAPLSLPPNQPADRFYKGGEKIAAFRRAPSHDETATGLRVPEDWVASVTCMAGDPQLGLTVLPDGRTLADAIADDPEGWLGPDHVKRFGSDTKLLVKLLDAGQRLPVHAHPDTTFAGVHLGRNHGKAEAWCILHGGVVYLGLKADIEQETLAHLVDTQAVTDLLPLLHEVTVVAGDTVFVPAGTLHAIGEGIFLAELQEPEDLSILLEWRGFELDGAADGHLGLGFDVALGAIDRRGRSRAEIDTLITSYGTGDSLLAPAADEFFRLGRTVVSGTAELEPGFAVLIVTDGSAELRSAGGYREQLAAGATVVVPYGAGPLHLSGEAELLIARPPRPTLTSPAHNSPAHDSSSVPAEQPRTPQQ